MKDASLLSSKNSKKLSTIRRKIDQIDDRILDLLRSRETFIGEIAQVKADENLDVRQPKRYVQVMRRINRRAKELGLDPELVRILWNTLHMYSIEQQEHRLKRIKKDRSWLHKTIKTRITKT